jgi:hypothetical protein
VLPWFVMTGRLAFGAGSGSMNFHWNSFGSFLDYNETAGFSAGGMSIIPEAFFMPTSGRHFIISASLPMTVGSGTFTKYNDPTRVIDGQHFTYSNWALAIGLGYQWYFGAEQRTNLILMGHLGGGAYKLTVHWRGDDYTSDSMRSGIFDISVGSTHRFACNFVLGGTLDIWTQQFSGAAGGTNFFDTDIAGGMSQLRLNMIFGYAFF